VKKILQPEIDNTISVVLGEIDRRAGNDFGLRKRLMTEGQSFHDKVSHLTAKGTSLNDAFAEVSSKTKCDDAELALSSALYFAQTADTARYPEWAVSCLCHAWQAMGFYQALSDLTTAKKIIAKSRAEHRHNEDYLLKNEVMDWLKDNFDASRSNEETGRVLAKIFPIKQRTLTAYTAEYRRKEVVFSYLKDNYSVRVHPAYMAFQMSKLLEFKKFKFSELEAYVYEFMKTSLGYKPSV
jgi:hypothetical protein